MNGPIPPTHGNHRIAKQLGWPLFAAIFAPAAISVVYIVVAKTMNFNNEMADWTVLSFSATAGSFALLYVSSVPQIVRIIAAVAYWFALFGAMPYMWLLFACTFFGDCI